MNMKKISAILLAAAVSVTLFAGCGSKNAAKNNAAKNNTKVENTKEANKEEANKEETKTEETVALQDGTFKAEKKAFDENGWKAFTEVTVKEGKIEAVVFDYINEAGALKSADAEYAKKMEEVAKTTPTKAAEELTAQLIEKQKVEEVQAVTGATSTSDEFKALVTSALEASKAGATETVVVE